MTIPKMSLGGWAFAFGPYESDPWSLSKVLQYLADNNYDGVELCGFQPHVHPDNYETPAKLDELKKELDDLGLGVSGIASDFTQVPPSQVDTEDFLVVLRKNIAICEKLGVPSIRFDSVVPPDELSEDDYEKRFKKITDTWRSAAIEADKAGIKTLWEFEPGFWLNKPSEVKRTYEAVGQTTAARMHAVRDPG